MTDFIEQDLSGSTFRRVDLSGARLHDVDLSRARVRAAYLDGVRMTGVEVPDLEIYGELGRVVVNGVDVAPLVEAELDRRIPERALMRPTDADGFRTAFDTLDRLWAATVERARALPPALLHEQVDEEWSFTETLRHLGFAHACWVGGVVLADPAPWHPLDLPWDEAPPGWKGLPRDRGARPSLDEALVVRRERQAMVREVMANLTPAQLSSTIPRHESGRPRLEDFPLSECLFMVVTVEWHHRLSAERDLAVLEQRIEEN